MSDKNRVCPVEYSGGLEMGIRRWIHNPRKILKPYVKEGMTAVDLGCGPGFFTVDMARLAGGSGRVFACDLQDGMLEKLKAKIKGTDLEERITLHKCESDRIGVSCQADFALAFYMVHEVPDQAKFLAEVASILKPDGQFLMVEPPFHVSKSAFEATVLKAKAAGLAIVARSRMLTGMVAVFKKA
jgi:ubiquinone/menaquinone biosynthesis C-methylase UbiE